MTDIAAAVATSKARVWAGALVQIVSVLAGVVSLVLLYWLHGELMTMQRQIGALDSQLSALKGQTGDPPNIASLATRVGSLEQEKLSDRVTALEEFRRAHVSVHRGEVPSNGGPSNSAVFDAMPFKQPK